MDMRANSQSNDAQSARACALIRVTGIVQGVGFRPLVWQYANQLGIDGQVCNDAAGVEIRCAAEKNAIESLVAKLRLAPPPNARIDSIDLQWIDSFKTSSGFAIIASHRSASISTNIGADLVTCDACKNDIFEAGNRRHGYAFTNCTHCGPRLSITRHLPYDRAQTSMASFSMCPDCQNEYDSPADRRFHAQPNACSTCGPNIWLADARGEILTRERSIDAATAALRNGMIVAIKGLGGFQLAVDASNSEAVLRLRQKKHRPHKPFALMAADIDTFRNYCDVSEQAKALLHSAAGPIVTLPKRRDNDLAGVAPDQQTMGFMLPTTPLHHLLLANWQGPLVMTSANPSGQPQCIENQDALTQLGGIADRFLMHDRDIVQRVDDSVVQLIQGQPQILRRARGYAPEPLALPPGFDVEDRILAMGGDLKNTFCLLDRHGALLSQHIGDLQDAKTLEDLDRCLSLYRQMKPGPIHAVAVDQHPHYQSRALGEGIASNEPQEASVHAVQHHHAHAAACLGDNDWPLEGPKVLAITLDGMGFAEGFVKGNAEVEQQKDSVQDLQIWGGEILITDYRQCQAVARLAPTPLPGGDKAMTQPWRNLFAHLHHHLDWDYIKRQYPALAMVRELDQQPLETLASMMDSGLNAPLSSSCGRLFDAVAAALGICASGSISYEGQAAMQLQACLSQDSLQQQKGYPFTLCKTGGIWQLNPAPMWAALLTDLAAGHPRETIAGRFHMGLAQALANACTQLASMHKVDTAALSGGVFQNRHLQLATKTLLEAGGLTVLTHRQVPANDGGLALGQALVCAARSQSPRKADEVASQYHEGETLCV